MKKGFTLIELLAVIVILAIIALIATPIVLNIINDARESSTLRSADFYLDAVEYTIADAVLYQGGIEDRKYPIDKNGDLCKVELDADGVCQKTDNKSNTLEVEVNGEKPSGGFITIENGNIEDVYIILNNKTIIKSETGELEYQEQEVAEPTPEPTKLCTANTEKATALVKKKSGPPTELSNYEREAVGLLASVDGPYTPGVSYTCNFIDNNETNNMTFFVLSSTENEVTLIAGANLGGTVAWSEDGSNHRNESEDAQAVTAKAALADRTKLWSIENGGKLNDTQMATIKLPTVYQLAEASGTTFDIKGFGVETWLSGHTTEPIYFGYWTSTPYAGSSNFAFRVYYMNSTEWGETVDSASDYGVRPVITLSKSEL